MHRHSLLFFLELIEKSNVLNSLISVEGWGYGSRTNIKHLEQTKKIFKYYGYKSKDYYLPEGGHEMNILTKESHKHVENIAGLTNSVKDDEIRICGGAILEDSLDKLEILERLKVDIDGEQEQVFFRPEDVIKKLIAEFNKESDYNRNDEEFIKSLGVASDHNRMFITELQMGYYI